MVYSFKRFRCGKCKKGFPNYRDAQSCELGHIVSEVLDECRKQLADIVAKSEVQRAQAIEARRAETGTGSVHESAVHAPISPSEDQTNEPG